MSSAGSDDRTALVSWRECSSGCMCGAHVCSKFFRRRDGRPECWHFELVTSETASELWTRLYREWYFSLENRLARGGRCKGGPGVYVITFPQKLTKNLQKGSKIGRRNTLCVPAWFQCQEATTHGTACWSVNSGKCPACHVFQQSLCEVQEAWPNSACKTV